jgi:hypothetical protein
MRAGLGAVIVGSMITALPASADTLSGFVATARAAGMRMSYDVPGFLVVEKMIDGGGPVAEVSLDALDSGGFASLPFPGDNAIAFGSLFAAGTGQDLPASYPLYVSARNPGSPSSELSDPSGFYRLAAKAAAGTAEAEARMARLGDEISGGSTSATSVVTDGQTVTATAVSRSQGIALGGGALQIGLVESRSVTKYTAGDAGPVTTKSMLIQGGSAGGTAFSVGPGGMVMGGASAPVPFGEGMAQLNKGLAPAGLSMGFAQGSEPDSIQAFEVGLTHPVPAVAGQVQGRYRLRFGETSTRVAAQGLAAPSVVEAKPADAGQVPARETAADPTPAPTSAVPSATDASTPLVVSFQDVLLAPVTGQLNDSGLLVGITEPVAAPLADSAGEVASAPTPAGRPQLRAVPAARSILAPVGSAEALGWVLAALGLVAVAGAWALRGTGASRWTS